MEIDHLQDPQVVNFPLLLAQLQAHVLLSKKAAGPSAEGPSAENLESALASALVSSPQVS